MSNSARMHELISNIVLDPDIAVAAARDAIAIAASTSANAVQELSIARAEAWRQLRARNVFPHDVPVFDVAGDPVSALTPIERAALSLTLRLKVAADDVARILGTSPADAERISKTARRELARAAIAMAMLTNPTKCPVTSQAVATLGSTIKRGQAMSLVSHAAECSICVPVLRTVDKQIVSDFAAAAAVDGSDAEMAAAQLTEAEIHRLIERAGLIDGFAPRDRNLARDPKVMIRRAAMFAAVSAVLIGLGLVLAGR